MAIDKKKNCSLQITISHEEKEQLETIVKSYRKEGVKVSKSDIMRVALKGYVKILVAHGEALEEEEPQKENKDA